MCHLIDEVFKKNDMFLYTTKHHRVKNQKLFNAIEGPLIFFQKFPATFRKQSLHIPYK